MEIQTFNPEGADLQRPFDAAVVIPTVLRPKLIRAAQSVFVQSGVGRIQLLIGVDKDIGDAAVLDHIRALCPANCALTVIDLGYSTACRHGGLHEAFDGGALRALLTFAANSRYVAYLDDDNRFAPDHLASLLKAIEGRDWAYGLRWYVNPYTEQPICIDRWESVGPGNGVFAAERGGFVDPNCMLVDKLACLPLLHRWARLHPEFRDPDRNFFEGLSERPCGASGSATTFYSLSVIDPRAEKQFRHIRNLTGELPRHDAPPLVRRRLTPRFRGPGKVFGIGLARTGTGSLGEALRLLGLTVTTSTLEGADDIVEQAAVGGAVADGFERLDQRYPGSLFVMTVRAHGGWLESCERHWPPKAGSASEAVAAPAAPRRLYGGRGYEKSRFNAAYMRHMARAYAYFANRPDDLLFLDICGGGDSWTALAAFLGLAVPNAPFPHRHKSARHEHPPSFSRLINVPWPSVTPSGT